MRRWMGFAVLAFAVMGSTAKAIPVPQTVIVDRPSGFGTLPFDGFANTSSTAQALSQNGQYAVYTSASNALLAGAQQSATNVFRVDLTTGAIVQVDTTAGGGQPNPGSYNGTASISADGNLVGFETTSPAIDPAASSQSPQFVVKNLSTGVIEDASVANGADGTAATGFEYGVLSGDGDTVAFTAEGPLVASNATGVTDQTDVYLRSLGGNTTQMMSVTTAGAEGGGVRSNPSVDYAGDAVAFTSTNALVATAPSGENGYVRDVLHNSTLLVTFSTGQTSGAESAYDVAIAGSSGALDVAWDNGYAEWLAPCSTTCTTPAVRVDNPQTGGSNYDAEAGPPFFPPELNGNLPTRVYFPTAGNLSPSDTDKAFDIYGWDIGNTNYDSSIHLMTPGTEAGGVYSAAATQSGTVTTLFSSPSAAFPGADGQYAQVYKDVGGTVTNVSQPPGQPVRTDTAGSAYISPLHATSDDGHLVAFESSAPALGATAGSDEPNEQVLVRNIVTGQTQLASAVSGTGTPGNGSSSDPGMNAAGNEVVFESTATNLVPGLHDANNDQDVFVHNFVTGQTELVDRTAGGGVPLDGASDPEISADGAKVVFVSKSPDLPNATPDGDRHVYEVSLTTGDVTPIDETSAGVPANGDSEDPDIDSNGGRVAFESDAANLGGSTNGSVYVRDLTNAAHPTTTWVSVPQDGNPAHDDAFETSIDATGDQVAWTEESSSFGFGINDFEQVFVRNLSTHATTLVSAAPAGAANNYSSEPSLSDNGSLVSFQSEATNLSGAVPGYGGVYVHSLVTRTTVLGATRSGSAAAGDFGADDGSISGDGDCIAFDSTSDNLVSGGYGSDFEHVYLHALNGACPPVAPPPPKPAPVIKKLSVTHKRFKVGKRGTKFKFTLSEAATVKIVIKRRNKKKKLLTLTVKHGKKGSNSLKFTGRYGHHKHLARGAYTATATATASNGKHSKRRSVKFTIT